MRSKHARRPAARQKLVPRKQSTRTRENPIYVQRAPFLISYWRDKRLTLENYLTRRKIAASPEILAILDFCSEGRRLLEIVQRWPEHSPDSLLGAVARLTKETLLQVSRAKKAPDDTKQKELRNWKAWNPAASFFHLSTKDTYADEVTPEEIAYVEQLAKLHPVPKPLKAYPKARVVRLKRGGFSGEFPRVLWERRTWREFSGRKVSRENLSILLELSFGIQAWEDVPTIGRLAQKTSPSGGALHPCEAYVLTRRVEGVASGIYHYDSGGHRLQLLRRGMTSAEIQRYLAGQWWFRDAAFLVLLTAVFGRTQWKYDYARAYRAVLMEAGHLCQTFCLTATWLGLAPFCTIAVADTKIEESLGVDGISESILYAMGAGQRAKSAGPV